MRNPRWFAFNIEFLSFRGDVNHKLSVAVADSPRRCALQQFR